MVRHKEDEPEESFGRFFADAEKSPAFWLELAKLDFTEEVVVRMKELGWTKSQLAAALSVSPAMVTRIVSGQNNFELATMVKIARALGCEFRAQLARPESKSNGSEHARAGQRRNTRGGSAKAKEQIKRPAKAANGRPAEKKQARPAEVVAQ